jgi:hypothetical protein
MFSQKENEYMGFDMDDGVTQNTWVFCYDYGGVPPRYELYRSETSSLSLGEAGW